MQHISTVSALDETVSAFDSVPGAPAPLAPVPREPAGNACQDDPDVVIELATHRAGDPQFRLLWRALVVAGASHQKIYQTPDYFEFQRETYGNSHRFELLTVSRRSDGALIGVVPVRLGRQELVFGIGKLVLFKAKVELLNLMGSIPAVPGGALTQSLALQMLATFPHVKAIFMHALPLDSAQWRCLTAHGDAAPVLGVALMGPWRDCHTLPLPASFEQYLGKFSAKKRYNLGRQVRQLGEQAGSLALQRVALPADVEPMMAALTALVPPDKLAGVMRPTTFKALAGKDLLLCYVLRGGDEVLAAVIGTRSPDVWHIHNIFVTKSYHALSVGTTAVHLSIKEVMTENCFASIDFGFGTPNHDFRSSHVLDTRAQVLVFDSKRPVRLLFRAHALFNSMAEGAIARVKALRKKFAERRAKVAKTGGAP